MTEACTVYVTTASRDDALSLARLLVAERLAACANVIPSMTSVYRWQEKVEEGSEAVLLLKTRRALFPRVEARIRSLHSYDSPCIVAWPIVAGADDYLNWIAAETLDPGAIA